MNSILKNISYGLSAALLGAMSFAGCVSDNYDCPPDEPDPVVKPGGVSIRFDVISNQDKRSRAADIEGDMPGSAPEDYIDISSMQFLLFDSNERFLQFLRPVVTADGASGEYTALATFEEPYFEQAADGTSLTFFIMALANGNSMGAPWAGAERGATTVEQLCNARQNTLLTARPVPSSLMSAPYIDIAQKFPMAGLQHFTVSVSELKASTEESPVDLSAGAQGRTLNMLRALAKIEVIDKANYIGTYDENVVGNDPCRIDKAEVVGFFNRGNQLPLYTQWMRGDVTLPETQQVIAPSVPLNCGYLNPPAFSSDNDQIAGSITQEMTIDMAYDSDAQNVRQYKEPVWSAYVYEFSNPAAGITVTQNPYIRITTAGDGTTGSSLVLPFRMGTYSEGAYQAPLNEILRNHIYRYEITKINTDGSLTANWTVCPMTGVNIIIPPFN